MERRTPAVAALLLLLCWTAIATAEAHWHRGYRFSPADHRSPNTIETLPRRRLTQSLSPLLNGALGRGLWRSRGGSRAVAGGGRAMAMAGGGGPWAATGGRDGRPWAVTGGSRGGGPWAVTTGGRGAWAATGGGRGGPWAVTSGGQQPLYATNGWTWPRETSGGRHWSHRSATGYRWPFSRLPGNRHGHHGRHDWGFVWTGAGRDTCHHDRRRPWSPQPTPDAQPTEQPAEQPTEEPVDADDYEGSAVFPEERSDPPAVTAVTPVEPTPPEKDDCPEGAVFLDGRCVCRDPKPFLDTILERCVDFEPTIQ